MERGVTNDDSDRRTVGRSARGIAAKTRVRRTQSPRLAIGEGAKEKGKIESYDFAGVTGDETPRAIDTANMAKLTPHYQQHM